MNQNNIYICSDNLSEHTKSLDSIVLSDWNNSLKFHGSVISILLTLTSAIGLISSVICFIYINKFLQVNKINKLLMRVYGINLFCCHFMALIGHIMMSYSQNIWTCFLSLVPVTFLPHIATNTCMCISGIRYYTKLKAAQSQVVNSKQIVSIICYNKMILYSVQIIVTFLCYWFQIEVEFNICANIPMVKKQDTFYIEVLVGLLYYVPVITYIFVSVFCEVRLKRLFNSERQSRVNTNHPDHLAPWRAVGANLEENNIPQRSTYISICTTIVALTAETFYDVGFYSDNSISRRLSLQCTALLIFAVYSIFHLPLILIFTHNQTINLKIFHRQPPAELQFYDTMTIPNIELSFDNSEEAECSVNPTKKSAIYSINWKDAASRYIVHRDAIANVEQSMNIHCDR